MAVPIKLLQLAGWLRKRQADANRRADELRLTLPTKEAEYLAAVERSSELRVILDEIDRVIAMPDVFRQNEPSDTVEAVKLDVVIKTAGIVLDEQNADALAGATRVVDAVCASLARFLSVVILEPPPGLVEVIHRLEERDAVVLELLVDMIASDLARASRTQGGPRE